MAKPIIQRPFTNVEVPVELRDRLKTWAAKRGMKVKYVVAEAIRQYLAKAA